MESSEGRHPDTGLHDIQKLAAQHKAQEEERQAAREREVTPLEGVSVPSVVGMPVKAVSTHSRWLYIAGGGVFVLLAATIAVGALYRHAAGGAVAAAAVLPPPAAPAPEAPKAEPQPAVQQLPVVEPAAPEKKPTHVASAPKAAR